MKKPALALLFAVLLLAGCAGGSRVESTLPEFTAVDEGFPVCSRLVHYGFVDTSTSCDPEFPPYLLPNNNDGVSEAFRFRRNNLLGETYQWSDRQCASFIEETSEDNPDDSTPVTQMVALLLTAFATSGTTNNDMDLTTQLTTAASLFTNLGTLFSPQDDEPDEPDPMPGIALAKAEIRRELNENFGLDINAYPVSTAMADAERYHKACNAAVGEAALSRATVVGMQQLLGQ